MSMGFKRLQGLGWVALVFLVAISLYPLSLNVGAMHARLVKVDRQIVQTRKEISYLQAEIRARASLDQLEKWNDLLYGYDAPQAAQYLSGERALADLHGGELGPQAPVLVSAAYGLNAMPIGTIGNGGRVANAADTGPAAARPEAASPAAAAKAKAESGVSLAGLQTMVQPAASAGAAFRVIIAFGKFQGVTAATTPTGSFRTTMRLSDWCGGIISP